MRSCRPIYALDAEISEPSEFGQSCDVSASSKAKSGGDEEAWGLFADAVLALGNLLRGVGSGHEKPGTMTDRRSIGRV